MLQRYKLIRDISAEDQISLSMRMVLAYKISNNRTDRTNSWRQATTFDTHLGY